MLELHEVVNLGMGLIRRQSYFTPLCALLVNLAEPIGSEYRRLGGTQRRQMKRWVLKEGLGPGKTSFQQCRHPQKGVLGA